MAGKLFSLKIISPDKVLFSGEAEMVVVPGEVGELGVLADHASLLSTLKAGRVRAKMEGGFEAFEVGGGFIEVARNRVTVLVRPKEGAG